MRRLLTAWVLICIFSATLLILPTASASAETYDVWLESFQSKARASGIRQSTLSVAFANVHPNARVIELDSKQPERKKIGFVSYLHKVMSQQRIDEGRIQFNHYRSLLAQTEQKYAVPAEVVVALWGLETSYGKNTGGFDLIQALSTLAWDGRRRAFFEDELLNALFILQGGHVTREEFKGSWAGAMGQNQFMPSSWKKFAVDANGDGHKDIWGTHADIFASSSNYLRENGWNPNYSWGWQVILPASFPESLINSDSRRPLVQWLDMGIKISNSHYKNNLDAPVRLLVPDGGEGRAYLVTPNFDVILSWNRSNYFALTVGLLSDFISQNTESSFSTNP